MPPYADLELELRAVRLTEPDPVAAFVPAGGGEPLVVGRDAAALGELRALVDAADRVVAPLLCAPPVPVEEGERVLDHDDGRPALELARMTPAEAARRAGASIMPFITTGNTDAPTFMIGEKASDLLLAVRGQEVVMVATVA